MARCPFATWDPSPNFTAGWAQRIQGTMQHSTASTWASALATLKDGNAGPARVSSHFLIRKSDGHIRQLVDTANRSWAQRGCNETHLSIEHDDGADPWGDRPDVLYAASARLNRWCAETHGYAPSADTLPPHRACVNTACPAALDLDRIIIETLGGEMVSREEYDAMLAGLANTITAIKERLRIDAHHHHGEPIEPRAAVKLVKARLAAIRAIDELDLSFLKPRRGTRRVRRLAPTKKNLARVRAGHGR